MIHFPPVKTHMLAAVACILSFNSAAFAADQSLIDAAKKEGRVTWYTTEIVDQLVRPVAVAFERKYGIHVDYVRADSSELVLRVFKEDQAKNPQADVFDGSTTVVGLRKADLVLKWRPSDAAKLPKQYLDAEGYWVATNLYVLTPVFNTNLVAKGSEPHTYEDLLDPKWKNKMVWAFSLSPSGAPGFIGLILAHMGREKGLAYLTRLAQQNITSVSASARQVLNQVVSGEYAIGLQLFNDQASVSASQGAPVVWIPISPAMTQLSVAGLNKAAPHPNAGKLLIDFLISDEGQKLFRNAKYLTVNPDVPPLDPSQRPDERTFQDIPFTPEQIQAAMPDWVAIYDRLFR